MHLQRRDLLKMAVASALAISVPGFGARDKAAEIVAVLAELERRAGGRLGVAVMDLESGKLAGHRLDERFGMCSTFKLPLAAIILIQAQRGQLDLDTKISYSSDDLVTYAPVVEKNLERGYMTVRELAKAAQQTSDNAAANLLLRLIGGPAGFTESLRGIGDDVTRLDRVEPDMNYVPPGEVRDTTTPAAMAATLRRFLTGHLLSDENKSLLGKWMEETGTGLNRLRAGFPDGWRSGDKTGTGIAPGMPNIYNDVAVAWPDDATPSFIIAAYYEADGEYDEMRSQDIAVLRQVGEEIATLRRT
jgi:beta-lactamase class A